MMSVLRQLQAKPKTAENGRNARQRTSTPTRSEPSTAALDEARATLSAARSDAAAAKAEAAAARGDARRILDTARSEADGIIERANKQADHDSAQARAAARRAG